MEFWHSHCDSFGLVFQPFLQIVFGKNSIEKISAKDYEKLNVSTSTTTDTFQNTSTNNITTKNGLQQSRNSYILPLERNGKERYYQFDYVCEFEVPKKDFYNTLLFKIKNDLYNKVDDTSTLTSKTNYAMVGDCRIPIHLIVTHNNPGVKFFEGKIPIKQRGTVHHIGNLKVKIAISNSKPDSDPLETTNASALDSIFRLPSQFDDSPLHFYQLDPTIVSQFFTSGENDPEKRKMAARFLMETDALELRKITLESLFSSYKKITAKKNFLLAYEIFLTLFQMSKYEQYTNILIEFLSKTNSQSNYEIYQLPVASGNNYYLIKVVLMFLSNFLSNVKTEAFVDKRLYNMIFNIIKALDNFTLKRECNEKENLCEENISWCLSVIMELLSLPVNIPRNAEMREFKRIYDFAIDILSNRVYFLSLAEKYLTDADIVFSIVRMFRKIFQIVSDQERVKEIKDKDNFLFIYKLKKILISHQDGRFITLMQKIIIQYYHYPELFSNVLLILLELTHQTTAEDLAYVFHKVSFEQLSNSFEIYRGKLKYISKHINQLYLELLANFSEMCKKPEYQNAYEKFQSDAVDDMSDVNVCYEDNLKLIAGDLKLFYRMSKDNLDFRDIKAQFISIEEVISRIGVNITIFPKISFYMTDSDFFQDISEFIRQVGCRKTENIKDFFIEAFEINRKSMTIEQVTESIMLALENCYLILIKCIFSDTHELGEAVYNIMGKLGHPKKLLDKCAEYLSIKGCITPALGLYRKVLMENITYEPLGNDEDKRK